MVCDLGFLVVCDLQRFSSGLVLLVVWIRRYMICIMDFECVMLINMLAVRVARFDYVL